RGACDKRNSRSHGFCCRESKSLKAGWHQLHNCSLEELISLSVGYCAKQLHVFFDTETASERSNTFCVFAASCDSDLDIGLLSSDKRNSLEQSVESFVKNVETTEVQKKTFRIPLESEELFGNSGLNH